ncbi:hypothetical protein GCM10023317_20130 [Actinopolymorpha pittospori]|uniref:Uncharacterized protein n=1 Tax=Actinopolymorpha pittospori TaxID=648752 RepID=A0A927NAM6_9ACTN|nr:hypothetical protein [Actinopolymorpha pittospori]
MRTLGNVAPLLNHRQRHLPDIDSDPAPFVPGSALSNASDCDFREPFPRVASALQGLGMRHPAEASGPLDASIARNRDRLA